MKLEPLEHQIEGHERILGKRYFALLAEQGTGKTFMLLHDAERAWKLNKITGLLIIAPNGVHSNWTLREIPKLLEIPYEVATYRAGLKGWEKELARMGDGTQALCVFAINIDSIHTKKGFAAASAFLKKYVCIGVVDESQDIKNLKSTRTTAVHKLAPLMAARRILSGTPVPQAPTDAYSQWEFLKKGFFPQKTYRAFVARYARLLPEDHHLVRHISARNHHAGAPQIIQEDADGQKLWKNLDELGKFIAPYSFRVLKSDCLDLPEKIRIQRGYDLPPKQQKIYDTVTNEYTVLLELFNGLKTEEERKEFAPRVEAKRTLQRQIISGFILENGKPLLIHKEPKDNPRLALLKRTITTEIEGSVIIWAWFKEEIRAIKEMYGDDCVEYHGGIGRVEREYSIEQFQKFKAKVFLAHPQSAARGLTLTAANAAIFYSHNDDLEKRMQAEDRCHRIGTVGTVDGYVNYFDIVANGTVDEDMLASNQAKMKTGEQILIHTQRKY